MIGIGGKIGVFDIRQDQETLEITIMRGHQMIYNEKGDKLFSFQELQNILFDKIGRYKNGVRFESMG